MTKEICSVRSRTLPGLSNNTRYYMVMNTVPKKTAIASLFVIMQVPPWFFTVKYHGSIYITQRLCTFSVLIEWRNLKTQTVSELKLFSNYILGVIGLFREVLITDANVCSGTTSKIINFIRASVGMKQHGSLSTMQPTLSSSGLRSVLITSVQAGFLQPT